MSGIAPPPPPKDVAVTLSHPNSTSSLRPPSTRYQDNVNANDLAASIRDSVRISSPSLEQQQQRQQTSNTSNNSAPITLAPATTNPRRTPSPNLQNRSNVTQSLYTGGERDSIMTGHQPQLPSQRMASVNQNPFEMDEVEPVGKGHGRKGSLGPEGVGMVPSGRAKFVRAQTGLSNSNIPQGNLLPPASPPGGKGRVRRSMSSDSYGLDPNHRELTAGQKKALEDKKGSRHADVIDTWDPTGLGSAMWHHSGPYDAAAPSRNANLPPTKAPMQAFNGAPVPAPPRTGPTSISLAKPPTPPAKDPPSESAPRRTSRTHHKEPSGGRRMGGGGLTGQYSTSMPASGGYFPDLNEEGGGGDEAEIARKERQRQRDDKRRALKAAWGTDTPEPFEDFGFSPGADNVDLTEDAYPNEVINAPMRSPGLRLGLGQRSSPIKEMSTSPISENGTYPSFPPVARSGSNPQMPQQGGGVKRTKSLMQKFKTMRENPNNPMRSSSPKAYSPTTESPPIPSPTYEKPGFFSRTSGRSSPQKYHPQTQTSNPTQSQTTVPNLNPNLGPAEYLEGVDEHPGGVAGGGLRENMIPSESGGFVLVESPNSKARAIRALQKEQSRGMGAHRGGGSGGGLGNEVPPRVKGGQMPPVAPVLPDFDDFMVGGGSGGGLGGGSAGEGVKRKTSMVKKLKDRMVK